MWVFGYGSLMWKLDDLERYIKQRKKATLNGFHRDFNKSSTTNWGSKDNPAPTLGLEEGGSCIGVAYECNDNDENEVLNILQLREGSHFEFPKKKILVENVGEVEAYYSHNLRDASYIGNKPIKDRVKMCLKSEGKNGKCVDYVKNTLFKIREIQINDKHIEDFWKKIKKAKKWVTLQKTYYLSKNEFENQLDDFFDFLKKIQPLIIFITLFIALCAILIGLGITQDVEIPAYSSLNLILFFLIWAYVFWRYIGGLAMDLDIETMF